MPDDPNLPGRASRPTSSVATLVDVAREARVSIATASRAINGRQYVSAATRADVLAAAERLNFRPSTLARGFRVQRSFTVGMLVPDISSPFYAAALRGVEHVLSRHGYTVLVFDTEEQTRREEEAIDLLTGQRVAGLVIAPVSHNPANLATRVAQTNVALVTIDNRLQGYAADTVLVDNPGGAAALTEHLIAHGHRRIGHLAGLQSETSGAERLAGYRQALERAGIPFDPCLVAEGDWTEQSGRALVPPLLAVPDPPTALVIASSLMAVGALLSLRELGYRVPDDVAVACFDDVPWAPLIEPPLTTLSRQDYAVGAAAAALILDQLSGEGKRQPHEQILPMTLIVRRSCGCTEG
jgi:DNA-binding LacI/PurR family transcriptional regulator